MDMKRNKLIGLLSLCLLAATFASCEDWNETEAVKQKVERPEDQNPELWAEYTAALRDYKQSEHFIVYARLFNSPQPGTSEKDFMRCLPDSLDIVSLTNADNFSKYDAEDMPAMREKGTKVLYQVDYAGRSGELTDETKLGAYLDKVIAAVEKNGLDGYSFTGIPNAGDAATATAAALIVERLSAAKTEGQLLVFEGNPAFLDGGRFVEGRLCRARHRGYGECDRPEDAGTQRYGVCRRSGYEVAAGRCRRRSSL